MPKFVDVFTRNHRPRIRLLSESEKEVAEWVPDHPAFFGSLVQTCSKITEMIDVSR